MKADKHQWYATFNAVITGLMGLVTKLDLRTRSVDENLTKEIVAYATSVANEAHGAMLNTTVL
jgi:hypothetical protein